jgi:hypothetical protein
LAVILPLSSHGPLPSGYACCPSRPRPRITSPPFAP